MNAGLFKDSSNLLKDNIKLLIISVIAMSTILFLINFYYYFILVNLIAWYGDSFPAFAYPFSLSVIFSVVVLVISFNFYSNAVWRAGSANLNMIVKYVFCYLVFVFIFYIMVYIPYSLIKNLIFYYFNDYIEEISIERTRFYYFITNVIIMIISCLVSPMLLRLSFVFPFVIAGFSSSFYAAFKQANGLGWPMMLAISAFAVPFWIVFGLLPTGSGFLTDLLANDHVRWAFLGGAIHAGFGVGILRACGDCICIQQDDRRSYQ